jgi:UDP-N-acetylmuramoyl-L-alanyl-D-glutamate--2,6-diaminopimelate ligase
MKLTEISKIISTGQEIISANSGNEITEITLNSKEARNVSVFTAIKGFKTDGHGFIPDAYAKGCRDFFIEDEKFITPDMKKDSTIVLVNDSRKSLALASNLISGYPFNNLKMIGTTGTKGKTTVTTLLHRFLSASYKTAMFSTVRNIVCGKASDSERTTMEASRLQSLLRQSLDCGETHSVVEVSSHAVTLKRIEGINWDAGIFTNFSRDHLDLYGTMENYFQAKLDFFRALNASAKNDKFAIINIDDPKGREVVPVLDRTVKTVKVGTDKDADFLITGSKATGNGLEFSVLYGGIEYEFGTKMRGLFNITNMSLAAAAALELGIDPGVIRNELERCSGIEGRFEIIIDRPFTVIVDYAHTPDSLEKILKEARLISKGKVISVFGCTGDRDREKRGIMGGISALNADFTVITNDDTYTEDEISIAMSVEKGLTDENRKSGQDYRIIYDRYSAIREAMSIAHSGDVIIIAGMGHEKHQILNNATVAYNDKETVLRIAGELSILKRG